MSLVIKKWEDICTKYTDGLLLGNGASIALHGDFAYKSLKKHASDKSHLNKDVEEIFSKFHTDDFELILRIIWHAYLVNQALGINDAKTEAAYKSIRDALIQSVQEIHCTHSGVSTHLNKAYKFAKNFKTICSLNYDLTLYWICMYGNDIDDGHKFKDCFLSQAFDDDWERFRDPIGKQKDCTLFFYPHGNLIFARDKIDNERKLAASGLDDLLDSILQKWSNGSYTPLFVSEGTSDQKVKSIKSSFYLNTVYREVLPEIGSSVVIYGWGFGEHDMHILERICKGGTTNFAVSVYPDGNEKDYCHKVQQAISNVSKNKKIKIEFFCSKTSKDCWS